LRFVSLPFFFLFFPRFPGYAVISVNYRMGVGYGKAFRDCTGCGWVAAAEYTDVLAAAQWFGRQPFVDAGRVAIYGLSYGAFADAIEVDSPAP
jgi:dipeptidyl aminopeptidase/acylaminoacyl peptidase